MVGLQGVGGIEGGGLGGVWWGAWLAGLQSGCHGEDGSSMLTQRRRRVEVVMSDMVTGMVTRSLRGAEGRPRGIVEKRQSRKRQKASDPIRLTFLATRAAVEGLLPF